MNKIIYSILIFLVSNSIYATDYHVGPNQDYKELGEVPWLTLEAGDKVLIHWRSEPYREKIGLRVQGTANQPIVIRGIVNSNGDLPIISGENATTHAQFTGFFSSRWDEYLGSFLIKRASTDPWGYKPKYITIENIQFEKSHSDFTYTDVDGVSFNYAHGAAGIWAVYVENLIVRNCIFTNNGNGLFVLSKDSEEVVSRDILIEKNYFYNNGNVGRDREHNIYTQADNIVFQYNRIEKLRPGAMGSSLKDRSAGTIVRYNWIDSSARTLDLIEAEDSHVILMQNPNYHDVYVYGNILLNNTSTAPFSGNMIHYGGDTYIDAIQKKGTLHFYNNTVYIKSEQSDLYYLRLFDCTSNDNTVLMRNNIIYKEGTTEFYLFHTAGNAIFEGGNWINYEFDGRPGYSGSITNNGTIYNTGSPDFTDIANKDFTLKSTSICIDKSGNLPSNISNNYPLNKHYLKHLNEENRTLNGNAFDLGAFEFNGTLSINDLESNNSISISPNPTQNSFTIHMDNDTLEKGIIYNNLGQEVQKLSTNEVDISNLSSGIYFVKISSENGKIATKKIIKN